MQVFPTEERLADYAERAIGLFSPQERVRAAGGVAVSMLAAAIPPTVAVLAVWALATAWRDGGG
jgi:hypothetical protein